MLAARRLDGEDPKVVLYLRCAYAAVQCVAVIVIFFVYYKASLAAKDKANAVKIYVPPPPQVCSCVNYYFTLVNSEGHAHPLFVIILAFCGS